MHLERRSLLQVCIQWKCFSCSHQLHREDNSNVNALWSVFTKKWHPMQNVLQSSPQPGLQVQCHCTWSLYQVFALNGRIPKFPQYSWRHTTLLQCHRNMHHNTINGYFWMMECKPSIITSSRIKRINKVCPCDPHKNVRWIFCWTQM